MKTYNLLQIKIIYILLNANLLSIVKLIIFNYFLFNNIIYILLFPIFYIKYILITQFLFII